MPKDETYRILDKEEITQKGDEVWLGYGDWSNAEGSLWGYPVGSFSHDVRFRRPLSTLRASNLPTDSSARKQIPIATGFLDYFPLAVAEVARLSFAGNEQHNPGTPLHWDRAKSGDEADALMRHFMERGTLDGDGMRHSAKVAWRALALLQKELEGEKG